MTGFHGWDAGALWEDIKFDIKHFGDIERLADGRDKEVAALAWRCSEAVHESDDPISITPATTEALKWLG